MPEISFGMLVLPAEPTSGMHFLSNSKTLGPQVRRVADETWLVLLSELPDPDDDPDLVESEAEGELERRRMSFRRY